MESHLGIDDKDYSRLGAKILNNENEILSSSDVIVQLGMLSEEKSYFKRKPNINWCFKSLQQSREIRKFIKKKKLIFFL